LTVFGEGIVFRLSVRFVVWSDIVATISQ